MTDKNISPEERLFKVIQEGKNDLPGDEKFKKKNKIKINLRGIKLFFANLRPGSTAAAGAPGALAAALPINPVRKFLSNGVKFREIELKEVNKILIVVLIFFTGLVAHYAINKRPSIAKIINAVSSIQFQPAKKEMIETFEPMSFYLEEVKRRDIFQPRPKAKTVVPKTRQLVDEFKELVGDLTLQGISWGKFPKVMIKNKKEDRMFFLRQGQMIGMTGIEVKAIFKDKIVIAYEGEEMELR